MALLRSVARTLSTGAEGTAGSEACDSAAGSAGVLPGALRRRCAAGLLGRCLSEAF
jgi:hypothetical protein